MRPKMLVWILFLPLLLFFSLMLYIEVSMYAVLPFEKGGMSFWMEFKNVWNRSISFYALLLIASLLLYFHLKRETQTDNLKKWCHTKTYKKRSHMKVRQHFKQRQALLNQCLLLFLLGITIWDAAKNQVRTVLNEGNISIQS